MTTTTMRVLFLASLLLLGTLGHLNPRQREIARQKRIRRNRTCTLDPDCDFMHRANCARNLTTDKLVCVCDPGYLLDDLEMECRPILFAADPVCKRNTDCVHEADCENGECKCRTDRHYSKATGSCIRNLEEGERCDYYRDECVLIDRKTGMNKLKCMQDYCRFCGSHWALSDDDDCPGSASRESRSLVLVVASVLVVVSLLGCV